MFASILVFATATLLPSLVFGLELEGFTVHNGQICKNGESVTTGGLMNSAEECADYCRQSSICYGFNYRPFGKICVSRTPGCILEEDSGAEFYEKIGNEKVVEEQIQVEEEKAMEAQPVAVTSTSRFVATSNTRCTEGPSRPIGNVSKSLEECQQFCLADQANCEGVNFVVLDDQELCAARSKGCEYKEDSRFTFYKLSPKEENPTLKSKLSSMIFDYNDKFEGKNVDQVDVEVVGDLGDPMAKFTRIQHRRCIDVTSKYDLKIVQNTVEQCALKCLENDECTGFNSNVGSDGLTYCIVQIGDCYEEDRYEIDFYRRN